MEQQLTIYDYLYPARMDPVEELAKHATPYWVNSRKRIVKVCNDDEDIDIIAKVVHEEYCPYGYAGFYGGEGDGIHEYTFKAKNIYLQWYEKGKKNERYITYKDFARTICMMVWAGEYKERES